MTKAIQVQRPASRAVARPLRVLVPLIQADLEHAASAGLPYYIAAGEKLLEVKHSDQVPHGSWGRWLNTNFSLGKQTAMLYMRAAERAKDPIFKPRFENGSVSMNELSGRTEQRKKLKEEHRKRQQPLRAALEGVDVEAVSQDRQTHADEVALHRELALEMIDIGFKALATRLHPDRPGGSRAAMARANRVREELKQVAATRRFV